MDSSSTKTSEVRVFGIAAVLSIACWPLAYWINQQIYDFEPLPWSRLIAWNLPNVLAGLWMFFINRCVIRFRHC